MGYSHSGVIPIRALGRYKLSLEVGSHGLVVLGRAKAGLAGGAGALGMAIG